MTDAVPSPAGAGDADTEERLGRLADELARQALAGRPLAAPRPEPERLALGDTEDALAAARALADALGEDPGAQPVAPGPWPAAGPRALSLRYGEIEPLASGGMGIVYRARDLALGRAVALKLLSAGGSAGPTRSERFQAEARVTSQLEHPNIVPVHDLGTTPEGDPYYCMKLVRGRSLAERLDELDPRDLPARLPGLLRDFLKVCDAVAFAHSRGVVHRDLKPANVMLGQFGEVLVMDWGLARLASGPPHAADPGTRKIDPRLDPRFATVEGALAGTPAYMAPEQVASDPASLGPAADVYALGGILCSILTLRGPHDDVPVATLLARKSEGGLPPPAMPGAPWELAAVVRRAMAPAPEHRYPDVPALARDVEAWLEGRLLSVARYGVFAAARKWLARHRGLARLGAASLGALLALAAWSAYQLDLRRREIFELADIERLVRLEAEAARLVPASPENLPAIEAWLARARELAGRAPLHRRRLAAKGGEAEHVERAWHQAMLASLLRRLAELERPGTGLVAEMDRRLALARRVSGRKSPLVPLGRDPRSGLEEFAHLATGEPPRRDPEGALVLEESSAIVLVQLPGGVFTMGAHARPGQPGFHPAAREDEGPAHEVRLAPFYIGKHEVTQAQWLRLAGRNPSHYPAGQTFNGRTHTRLHPVESVSWDEARHALALVGLELPTEAQWEYAAQARAPRWWTTPDGKIRRDAGNLADRYARAHGGSPRWAYIEWMDDGHTVHAPIGRSAANPFGLHDVIGNVMEWCRDGYAGYEAPWEAGTGLRRAGPQPPGHVIRGSAFSSDEARARLTFRLVGSQPYRNVGLRAALRGD